MTTFNKILACLVLAISLLMISNITNAQRRKDRKKSQSYSLIGQAKETDPRIAENFFIEGEKYYILEDYTKSLLLFQKALEMQPSNATVQFKIAQVYTQTGDLDKALTYAQQSVNSDPSNKFYYVLLAQIYTKKSDLAHAAATYEKMINTLPGTDEYLSELAALYLYQKDYDNALKCYDRIENTFGVSEQVSLQKKEIYKKLGKLDKVIEEGNKLIDAYPGDPAYVELQANTLLANDRAAEAIELIQKWLPSYPADGNLLITLAEAYQSTGDKEKSREYIDRAFSSPDLNLTLKLQYIAEQLNRPIDSASRQFLLRLVNKTVEANPDKADSYAIYGDLLFRLDSADAAKHMYLKSLDLNDNNFQAWQNVINIEINQGDWDNVVKHSEKAVEVFPNQAILYFFLGTGYFVKKDYADAVANLEIGKKFATSDLQLTSWFNAQLGDAYYYLKDYAKSDSSYEAVLKFDPDNDHVLNNYSYFLSLRKKRLEYADKMSTKLINLHPDDPTYLDTRAWVLYNLGKIEDARKIIEKALQQKGDISGDIVEHYGDILYRLGKQKEAMEQWKKAKEMGDASDPDLLLKKISEGKLYE